MHEQAIITSTKCFLVVVGDGGWGEGGGGCVGVSASDEDGGGGCIDALAYERIY